MRERKVFIFPLKGAVCLPTHKFYSELAYLAGILALAFGTSCMTTADLGLSMVVAPAYLVHLKLSQVWPVITFGVAEYIVQAILLGAMVLLLRRFRPYFLLSFLTALLYGRVLDGCLLLWANVPPLSMSLRILLFAAGLVLCALGVSFVLHTYLPPEVYELLVKELSAKYHLPSGKVKTVYDCISCGAAVALSFLFFGFLQFHGVKLGTFVCAALTGAIVGWFNQRLERLFAFVPAFSKLEQKLLYPHV